MAIYSGGKLTNQLAGLLWVWCVGMSGATDGSGAGGTELPSAMASAMGSAAFGTNRPSSRDWQKRRGAFQPGRANRGKPWSDNEWLRAHLEEVAVPDADATRVQQPRLIMEARFGG